MTPFDDFWALYNYKIAKKAARRAWMKLSEADRADIMDILPERLATDKQWRAGFKPHPATFLNGERWEDEYEKCNGSNPGGAEGIMERLERIR